MVVVDGTQSIGALPFDISLVQPDLLVSAGYKWLMGGYGVSLAYFGERFDGGAPIEEVWTSQLDSDNFTRLSTYRDAYRDDGSRYDGGQRASFFLVPMLEAALDQLLAWGPEHIQAYCSMLTQPWMTRFAERGALAEPADARASHLFGLRCTDGRDMTALANRLRETHVHVSIRGDAIRVAPHIYNSEDDLHALWCGL
jgi:selenocysteine lyase/cysteine desulfurase